ncbi:MAG TPA: DUF2252 family protein [Opitutaceae bacterium]|jgi:uncharacterized protein (DUF2252 family)|nr:DUF2252 family protein [Opitutaceae bacterium]
MDLLDLHFRSEQGCDSSLIRLKRSKMAGDVLNFYRGSPQIFYAIWGSVKRRASPLGWLCGDAHWENVGSYKGKNHVAYFDFTDFDHGCLAPLDFDLGRAATCLYLIGMGELAGLFLSAYTKQTAAGKPYHIENEVAKGTVARLLTKVQTRSQRRFMRQRMDGHRLLIDDEETYALPPKEKREASAVFKKWAATTKDPSFFRLEDLCGSCTGLGILGHHRYLALVSGKKARHIIDMKEAVPSAAAPFSGVRQPSWANDAERIAEVQRMIQYVPIARLGWTKGRGRSFVLSEYQPAEDRVDSLALSKGEYRDFAKQWGQLLAWSHLRGAGWREAATTSELVTFASDFNAKKRRRLLARARAAAVRMRQLFEQFRLLAPQDKK